MSNVFDFLKSHLVNQPSQIKAADVRSLTDDQKTMLLRLGVTSNSLNDVLYRNTYVSFERMNLYREFEKATLHPLMSSAVQAYTDYATTYSSMHNGTVFVQSDNREYKYQIEKMLDSINVEENIYDWAWTLAMYGDLFCRVFATPSLGISHIDDTLHPLSVSRIDVNGRLIGFFETPEGYLSGQGCTIDKMLPPWQYVHMRSLGSVKRRHMYSEHGVGDYRASELMSTDYRQVTSKYGTSVLRNALPIYKRLRMIEDAIMMARLSRGIKRYIYKLKVDGSNLNAVGDLIDTYTSVLKRARSLNTDNSNPSFSDRYEGFNSMEDIILPVWGDVGDLAIESVGGEVDIRWIKDQEESRNQLSSCLGIPLSVLGGYNKEAPGGLNTNSLERIDIRFARTTRRLQRAIISSLTRMAQIHLAYQNKIPDLSLFSIHMSETSTAEEEEIRDMLDKGCDVVTKVVNMVKDAVPDVDAVELIMYLNDKILKLNDFDLRKFVTRVGDKLGNDVLGNESKKIDDFYVQKYESSDLKSQLPTKPENLNEGTWDDSWNKSFGDLKVEIKPWQKEVYKEQEV